MQPSVSTHRSHEESSDYSEPRRSECPRCGAQPVETYDLPDGCIEAFCTACTEAPRYFGYVVKAQGCEARS